MAVGGLGGVALFVVTTLLPVGDPRLAPVMGILGLLAAAYAIQATLRLRAEETTGRAEPVLACAVGRLRRAASHLIFSILGSTAALVAAALATAGLTGLRHRDLPA